MTVLMSDPASLPPWHRVLPKPSALFDEGPYANGSTQLDFFRRNSAVPVSSPPCQYSPDLGRPHNRDIDNDSSPMRSGDNAYDLVGLSRRNTIEIPALSVRDPRAPPPTEPSSLLQLSAIAASRTASFDSKEEEERQRRDSHALSGVSPTAYPARPYLPPSVSEPNLFHQQQHHHRTSFADSGTGRKRSASLMTAAAGVSASSDEPLQHTSSSRDTSPTSPTNGIGMSAPTPSTAGGTSPQFCLCRTDPKIPRPRNAFILYRQHNQAAVVAQNPGLANPDISKIIGKQWSELPQAVKDEWKALAEEEKARHQQQYPDYRYQPRRYGRNSTSGPSSGSEQSPSSNIPRDTASNPSAATVTPTGNCTRCGGKVMNPPSTPVEASSHSPTNPRTAPQQPQQVIHSALNSHSNMGPLSMPLRSYSQRLANSGPPSARMGTAGLMSYQPTSPLHSATSRVRPHDEYAHMPAQYHHAASRGDYGQTPLSPDAKRRRFNGSGVYIPPRTSNDVAVHSGAVSSAPGASEGSDAPHPYYSTARRPSVGRPIEHQPPPPSMMGPPTRGYRAQTLPAPGGGHQDLSLTLPPLQTGPGSLRPGVSHREGSVSSGPGAGIEGVVMSVQPINKIKILAKVAPPLPLVPSLHRSSNRGAIIAVEGADASRVKQMVEYLANFLGKDEDGFEVRQYSGADLDSLKRDSKGEANVKYLEMVRNLHSKSKDMVAFVTKTSEVDSNGSNGEQQVGGSPTSAIATTSKGNQTIVGGEDVAMVDTTPTSVKMPMTMDEDSASSSISPKTKAPTLSRSPLGSKGSSLSSSIPVALISRYQLSAVDTAAMTIPINDSYAPLDHWQWSAALMRGCVGPDITIVVRDDDHCHTAATASTANGQQSHGNTATNVEIRLMDARCVIVTEGGRRNGHSNDNTGDNARDVGIDEKALRRVVFEVDEFLRK